MSSHHVVREKQEPALLVLGLNDFSDEILGQLLEWSPTVITTPDTAEKLGSYGIKIDYIIGKEAAGVSQPHINQLDPGDGTIVRSALKYLADNGYPSVNIVADNLELNEYEPFAGLINLLIFHDDKKIYPVTSGFSKWQPAGTIIEVLSPVTGLQFTGLELVNHQRYTTTCDGFFTLSFTNPFAFIAEEV